MEKAISFESLKKFLTQPIAVKILNGALVLLFLYIVYRITKRLIRKFTAEKFKAQTNMLIERGVRYTFNIIAALYMLNLFGIKLDAVLGAAGIAGVAIGFAAQTSFSNIISGFFVLSEKTMKIGDFITIDNISGSVYAVDLLSVKILTPDNQLIRVPNETIIKTNLINSTFFPIRRMTVRLSVAYKTNLQKAYDILQTAPALCPTALADPAPVVFFDGFGASGIDIVLAVWFKKENLLATKNAIYLAIKKVFDDAHIEIPFPQIVIHDGDSQPSANKADSEFKTKPKALKKV